MYASRRFDIPARLGHGTHSAGLLGALFGHGSPGDVFEEDGRKPKGSPQGKSIGTREVLERLARAECGLGTGLGRPLKHLQLGLGIAKCDRL